jgi:hypothetical protein
VSQDGLRECIRPLLEWITPGQDGMCSTLFATTFSVFRDFFPSTGFERPVRLLCHLLFRQQTWQEIMISIVAARPLQVSQAAAASASTGGRYCSFLASTAQPMWVSLLANATAAALWWVRDVNCANHALRPDCCFVRCCVTAHALCTNSLGKQELPTFADTGQLLLAAGGCSRGTAPILAANSQPLWKALRCR